MDNNLYNIQHFKSESPEIKDGENLSLFIDNQIFMFAVFNKSFSQVNELCSLVLKPSVTVKEDYLTRLNLLLSNYQLTNRQFKSITISVLNNDFTLMPEAFLVESNSKNFLEFSSGEKDLKNAFTYKFNDINLCYTIERELFSFLEKSFKNATIRHAGGVCINLLFSNYSLKNCNLFLNFNEGVFELAAKDNNKLIYYNSFHYETNEDVLYYLLFMMEQYELNPLTCKLVIAGQMAVDGDLLKAIKKYIKHVTLAVSDKSFVNSLGSIKQPNHYFFSLLNQHLCE